MYREDGDGYIGCGEDDHGAGAEAVGQVFDAAGQVLAKRVRQEVLGAGAAHEVFFAGRVDADDAVAHAAGAELGGDVAETTTGTWEVGIG